MNEAQQILSMKRSYIPGMNPIYDNEYNKKFNSNVYQGYTN